MKDDSNLCTDREFYLNTKGWPFAGYLGLEARITSVEDLNLTEKQREELEKMRDALREMMK